MTRRTWALLGVCVLIGAEALGAAAGTPLIEAVKAGDHAAIRRLARDRAAVTASEPDGTTPLHWAVRADDASTVRLLLRSGAKVNAANRYGVTPLALAALNRSAGMVGVLLEAGADPKIPLPEGQTILMAAARAGDPGVLKLLLDAGADVNAAEHVAGETPLMWAALENHADAVTLLIATGANANGRSSQTVVLAAPLWRWHRGAADRIATRELDTADVRRASERRSTPPARSPKRVPISTSPIQMARPRSSSRSSTGISISRGCSSRRAPTRTWPTARAWRRSMRPWT